MHSYPSREDRYDIKRFAMSYLYLVNVVSLASTNLMNQEIITQFAVTSVMV
jgi:hypothetical protein